MGLEAKSAAWDVEREIDREAPAGVASGGSGARAEFLANLGRRVAELSSMLAALARDPASIRLRDDLRRRVHALGAGARLLRFERLSTEVAAAEELLGGVAERGALEPADGSALRAAFERLPTLSWTTNAPEAPPAPPAAKAAPAVKAAPVAAATAAAPRPWPLSVLVVGPKAIADALVLPTAEGASAIEVERTEDSLRAIDLARAVAPDVIVIDTDQRGARELIEAVRKDPLTAAVSIVALGAWSRAEDAAAFLVAGATRTVHKPVSPDALRRVCRQASSHSDDGTPAEELGNLSLPELAARLAREVERSILDGAEGPDGEARIDLGRGDDLLGAVWTAAARVRDMVTIRSRGEIRFTPGAAERALPVGAWMHETSPSAGPTRRGGPRSALTSARALTGARVLVADDDPAVAWFLAGVLRAEGATVHEACDGAVALRKALEHAPDLVLTDVLMPNVDGLTLTDILRSDPLLADVPVMLLSWKDDLLQRARELGSRADAYLRKDASGATVVERARELLFAKARLAERIAAGGEVHGRADGFTMRTVLTLVCAQRPASIVEVRDAAYLYEIEIDAGRPINVTRTSKDGTFVCGPVALARLLGVRAGRFVIAPRRDQEAARAPGLQGTLDEQLRPLAAAARGAVRLLSGAALAAANRITFDEDWLAGYGSLAPEPARAVIRRLAHGEAPRKLLASGIASARLLEEVVRDAAARGAIASVLGPHGDDLLPAAVLTELAILRGVKPPSPASLAETVVGDAIAVEELSPSGITVVPAGVTGEAMAPAPEHLATATIAELLARGVASAVPPSVAAAARGGVSESGVGGVSENGNGSVSESGEGSPSVDVDVASEGAAPAGVQPPQPLLTLGSLTPPPSAPRIEPRAPKAPTIKMARARVEETEEEDESPAPRRSAKSQSRTPAVTPDAPAVKPKDSRMGVWIMCAVAGIVFAVGARISQDRRSAPPTPPPVVAAPTAPAAAAPATSAMPATSAAAATPMLPPVITVPGDTSGDPILPQEAPLRSDEKIPRGQGLLEVVVGPSDEVSIDGQPTVAGPVVKATLAPREKPYEIKVKLRGEDRTRYALVKEGKRTRVRVAPPWNR